MNLYKTSCEVLKKVIGGQCLRALDYLYTISKEKKDGAIDRVCSEELHEFQKAIHGEHEDEAINMAGQKMLCSIDAYLAQKYNRERKISDKIRRVSSLYVLENKLDKTAESVYLEEHRYTLKKMSNSCTDILNRQIRREDIPRKIQEGISNAYKKKIFENQYSQSAIALMLICGISFVGKSIAFDSSSVDEQKNIHKEKSKAYEKVCLLDNLNKSRNNEENNKEIITKKIVYNTIVPTNYVLSLPSYEILKSLVGDNEKDLMTILEGNFLHSLYEIEKFIEKGSVYNSDLDYLDKIVNNARKSCLYLRKMKSKKNIDYTIFGGEIEKKFITYRKMVRYSYMENNYNQRETLEVLSRYLSEMSNRVINIKGIDKEHKTESNKVSPYTEMILTNYIISANCKLQVLNSMMCNNVIGKQVGDYMKTILKEPNKLQDETGSVLGKKIVNDFNLKMIDAIHTYCIRYGYESPKKRLMKRYIV